MATGTYDDFLHALAVRESSNGDGQIHYDAMADGGLGYIGAYQFEEDALINLGYYTRDNTPGENDWQLSNWTGKNGIDSASEYLATPSVQDDAAHHWFSDFVWGWVKEHGLEQYIGTKLDGVEVTATGLLAGAHLRGADAVQQLLQSGGAVDPADPYGTPTSQYVELFSGYSSPFDPGAPVGQAGESAPKNPVTAPQSDSTAGANGNAIVAGNANAGANEEAPASGSAGEAEHSRHSVRNAAHAWHNAAHAWHLVIGETGGIHAAADSMLDPQHLSQLDGPAAAAGMFGSAERLDASSIFHGMSHGGPCSS